MSLAATFEDAAPTAPLGKRQSRPDDDARSNRKPAARAHGGDIDWQALVPQLPDHVRELAGPTLSTNPRAFIEANKHKSWAMNLGIDWGSLAPKKA